MIFKVLAGSMYCGILTVGCYGHTFHSVSGLDYHRRERVARIAGYKKLRLERVY